VLRYFNIVIDPEGKNLLMAGVADTHVNVLEGLFQKTMRLKKMKKEIHQQKMNIVSLENFDDGKGNRELEKLKRKKKKNSKRSIM
jgi:hypothetical protein